MGDHGDSETIPPPPTHSKQSPPFSPVSRSSHRRSSVRKSMSLGGLKNKTIQRRKSSLSGDSNSDRKDEANFMESWATEIDSWAGLLSDSQNEDNRDNSDKIGSIFSKFW